MAEAYRVRIGSEITHLPENEKQQAVAYARLARDRWSRDNDGKWVQGETQWYDGTFSGEYADMLHNDYQTGDALVVAGRVVDTEREVNGQTYAGKKMYVNSFGPDAVRSNITLDRTPRQDQSGAQTQSQQQSQAQAADQQMSPPTAAAEPAAAPSAPAQADAAWDSGQAQEVYGDPYAGSQSAPAQQQQSAQQQTHTM